MLVVLLYYTSFLSLSATSYLENVGKNNICFYSASLSLSTTDRFAT